jgi:C4-dicarboxylate transporter DctQ subunit
MLKRWLERIEEGFIALLLAAMTLLTFVQVVLRYVFNSGLVWALEATTYLFAWMVLVGASYVLRVGGHIGVDTFVKTLPTRGQRAVGIAAALLCLLYAALLLKGGYDYVARLHIMGVEAEDIPVERWILMLCLPLGFGLLFLRLAQAAWRILRGVDQGFRVGDEASVVIAEHEAEAAARGDARAPRP